MFQFIKMEDFGTKQHLHVSNNSFKISHRNDKTRADIVFFLIILAKPIRALSSISFPFLVRVPSDFTFDFGP